MTLEDISESGGADRIMDYITLLFLAAMKEIMLYQEKIYETLCIYPFDAAFLESVSGAVSEQPESLEKYGE